MKRILLLTFVLCFMSGGLFAKSNNTQMVQKLMNEWFTAVQNDQFDKAGSFLAPQFLSIHTDGITRNRAQEIELLKKLDTKSFVLSDFKTSESNNVIVATFIAQVQEKLEGTPLSPKKAGRMAILQKQGDRWLLLGYANLDIIKLTSR